MPQQGLIPIGRRMRDLAQEHPDKTALVIVDRDGKEEVVTWAQLEARSNQVARLLEARGAEPSRLLVIALRNSAEHYYATFATWKIGACILPLGPDLPERERQAIVDLAEPTAIFAEEPFGDHPRAIARADFAAAYELSGEPVEDRISQPGKSIGSGGSTGRPKIIVDPRPFGYPAEGDMTGPDVGMRAGQVQLVAGALFHNAPLGWSSRGLLSDHTLVVMKKFDTALALELIGRHKVQFLPIPPIIMQRIARLPEATPEALSSVESVMHTGAPCPAWVKRRWIELVGAKNVHEGFGASEDVGATNIHGDEWLEHPGSVGRPPKQGPMACELKILDEDGNEVEPGTVGEIYMKPFQGGERFRYIGSEPPPTTEDGFVSVGDMGWLDEDGWLFLADRRIDMIVTGGINVYPAEVEGMLTEHPAVADAAVIGIPDDEWGLRVHAVVQPADPDSPPDVSDLNAFCRNALQSFKVPKSYEFLTEFPRDEAGKIRRSKLVRERPESWAPGMIAVS